ncbi:hypothetical protein JL101_025865 [Skermanella rosea]|uniref:hypothetical protein n=1 Tax=Skermanella rosea TaxID=1817965 RepID=UPI001933B165|nr:hypothetical protein [Skermanella rosea]UEM03353.1 hypothetical protein JL101_025865 [Skermanella rosea]
MPGIELTRLCDPLTSIRIAGKQIFDKTPLRCIQFAVHVGKQQDIPVLLFGTYSTSLFRIEEQRCL